MGNPFLIMECAEESVADVLLRDGKFEPEDAREVMLTVADALEYLHGRCGIHRDIKPDNLLVTAAGYKVGDLGIVDWNDFDPAVTHGGNNYTRVNSIGFLVLHGSRATGESARSSCSV